MAIEQTTEQEAKSGDDLVRVLTENHILPCAITAEEVARFGKEAAEAVENLEALADEEKKIKKDLAARKASLEEKVLRLSRSVRSETVQRGVECSLTLNWTKQTATLVRNDTGETVNERAMSDEERRMEATPELEYDDTADEAEGQEEGEQEAEGE